MRQGQNIVQSDCCENRHICDEKDDLEVKIQFENIMDNNETESAVPSPAFSEDQYPRLGVLGETEPSSSLGGPQAKTHQNKLSLVKSQLSKLCSSELLKLTTTLRNHIKNMQRQDVTVSVTANVKSCDSYSSNVTEEVRGGDGPEEKDKRKYLSLSSL